MSRTHQPSYDGIDSVTQDTTRVVNTALQGVNTQQNQVGNQAVQQAVNGTGTGPRDDIRQLTPEYVEAHRAELGIPDGAPTSDFFMEFMAHNQAYQHMSRIPGELADPNTTEERRQEILAQQDMMRAWGYNPVVTEDMEVYDPNTGLYGFRLDPLEGEAGRGNNSIMAFRGSEAPNAADPLSETSLRNPWGWFQDWTSDFGQANPGYDQYYNNADRIREVMSGGTDHVNTTGHSLGGFLAQRAASQNPDLVDDIVTFQAGGVLDSEVDAFNDANADGHMHARHHSANHDVVNRVGEQHLPGDFFSHNRSGFSFDHTTNLMYHDANNPNMMDLTNGQRTVDHTTTDNVGEGQRRLLEGGRNVLGAAVRTGMALPNAAWQTGVGLGEMINNAGSGLAQTGSDLWGSVQGVGQMAGGLWNGAGQMLGGDLMGGLGTMGSGLWNGAGNVLGGLWDGAGSLLGTGAGIIGDTAGALWDGASSLGHDALMVGTQAYHGVKNLGLAAWEGAKGLGGMAMDGASWAGGKIADGASAAWEGAQWAGGKLADGAAAVGNGIADGASAAWEGTKWAGGKIADGASAVGGAIADGASKAWDVVTSW